MSRIVEEKVRIASMLGEAGVEIIEAGIPAMGEVEQQALAAILRLGLQARITSSSRADEEFLLLFARTAEK